ncbi:MAG: prepilin-type N-terminal cleavage/methylation domain-containing protein [Gammaproteobacteria bacterium]|nr:prepilin-type N-terminal cleavage/methylation domain-containing protein [Gammaproteobacteria bacterium]
MRELIKPNQQGFTLIETVMFIIIVGIAVSAVALQFTQNVRHSADPLLRQQAITFAHIYLDEITAKKWDETTPDGGGIALGPIVIGADAGELVRTDFDDVDDYHNLNETPLAGFTVSITVTYGTDWEDNPASPNITIPGAATKEINLTVSTPIGESLTFTQYRLNF